jgi:hypothetical protein
LALAAGDGLLAAEGLAAAAVVGLAGAVVGAAGAVVGLGAPPVWQALTMSANADAPAASKRILRIGFCSFRGIQSRVEGGVTHHACSRQLNQKRDQIASKP